MSETAISIRVNTDQRKEIEDIISGYQESKGIKTKGDAFYYFIMDAHKLILGESITEDQESEKSYYKLQDIKCNYISKLDGIYYCTENYWKNKKADEIGLDPKRVLNYCLSCQTGKEDNKRTKLEEQLRRENIRKLLSFFKTINQISLDGFNVDCFMCTKEKEEGSLQISTNGLNLYCALKEGESVEIKNVCEQTVNLASNKLGCKNLISFAHHVFLSEVSEFKKASEKIKDLPQLPKEIEQKPKQVDAEYKTNDPHETQELDKEPE